MVRGTKCFHVLIILVQYHWPGEGILILYKHGACLHSLADACKEECRESVRTGKKKYTRYSIHVYT